MCAQPFCLTLTAVIKTFACSSQPCIHFACEKKKTSYVNDRSTADITDYAGYIHTIVVFQKIPIPLLQYIFMLPEKENYSVLLHANIAAASARVLFFGNSVSVTQDQSGGEVVCVLHAKAWPS